MKAQETSIQYFQNAATANGNGSPVDVEGVNGAILVEVQETQGGTATLALQGSFNGKDWYAVGYYTLATGTGNPTAGVASLSRSVSNVSVTANLRAVLQVLDPYPNLQAVLSSVTSATVTARAYSIPV